MDDFIKLLKQMIPFKKMNLCPLYYQYYGSFCNGFGLQTSDVDFTILTNSFVEESLLLRDISIILQSDQNPRSRFIVKSAAFKARIPNLSIEDKQEKIDIDLSINNLLGVINTKLLYNYSQLHPFVQQGGVLIKIWAKKWDLIQKNKFSSYALILMWIYFLQQKHNLPNLQDSIYQEGLDQESFKLKYKRKVYKGSGWHPEIFVVNTYFLDDKQKQEKSMKNMFNNIPLKHLLIQFWEFYQNNGEYFMNDTVISIHSKQMIHLIVFMILVKGHQTYLKMIRISLNWQLSFYPKIKLNYFKIKMIIDLIQKVQEVSQIDDQRVQNALQFVIGSLKRIKFSDTEWPSVKFHSFGSQGNGFGTTSSDIDISLMTDHYTPEVPGLNFIFKSLRQIVDNQCRMIFIKDARVPFITITYQGQDVDIIMNNLLGIINTKLLKSYSLLHEKVKAGGILLKLWGKKNKVIDKPLISSYALILMWLCFLQRKYDLPDLQDQQYVSSLNYNNEEDYMLTVRRKVREDDECFKTDPRFIYYKDPLFKELQQKCQNLNNVKIEYLLQQFWKYYSFDGEYLKMKQKISIHIQENQYSPLENRDRNMDKDNLLAIIDPFDHKHNPGKQLREDVQKALFTKFTEASEKNIQQIYQLF